MIIRGPQSQRDFTVIDNPVIRNNRLSFKARGVLVYLLSQPENWQTSADRLTRQGTEGRDSIRAALAELEECGYLVRNRHQDELGRWVTTSTIVDKPQVEPKTEIQASVDRPSETRPSVNQALLTRTNEEELLTNIVSLPLGQLEPTDESPVVDETEVVFEEIWKMYPRRVDRKAGLKAFKARVRAGDKVEDLVRAVHNYAEVVRRENTAVTYVLHAATFFGPNERWIKYLDIKAEDVLGYDIKAVADKFR